MKVIEIYEYGNGDYAKPFWDRVQEKIDKIEEEYVGKNCLGMDTYKGDELFLTLFCKPKLKGSETK